jgi:hypothetical protein
MLSQIFPILHPISSISEIGSMEMGEISVSESRIHLPNSK